jgi:hypothetical protein
VCEHTFVVSVNDKGNIAELEIAAAAVRLGISVFKPLSEHARSDLVLEIGGRLFRVQCKWGRLSRDESALIVRTAGSRCSPNGYVFSPYTEDDVALFGVYSGELDRSFLLPVSIVSGKHGLHLRLKAPRNGQRACINLADNFEFNGAVAQLGERRAGSAKVRGSSPLSSTSSSEPPVTLGADPFRDRFGYWMDRAAAGEEVLITRRGKPLVRPAPAGPSDATGWNRQWR